VTKRLTLSELQNLQIRAKEAGLDNHQEYLTAFIRGDIRLNIANRQTAIKALGQLGKIGSNINQIAKAANEGRIKHLDASFATALETSIQQIEQIGRHIREAL